MGAAARIPEHVRVIADGPVTAAAMLALARRRPVVYLAHNLESSGFRPSAGHAGLERFERRVLTSFSETWMATRRDEQGAERLAGGPLCTRYVPNVIDTDAIEPVTGARSATVLFVADFRYGPNVEALEFLTVAVMPELWELRGDVELVAVGRGLRDADRDPRIRTPGFVSDLRSAYAAAAVAVVPLQRGGGSPLKFIEAMSYGLPTVATAHAAALLEEALPGRDCLVAQDARGFAAAVESLLADPARAAAVGAAGRELAVDHYSVRYLSGLLALDHRRP
jgi:glycosyltransferase involved in cell wall biosynthesis